MKKNRFWIGLIIFVMLLPSMASAAILHVGSGQDYSTVQGAVNAASSGDIIKVHPGTYDDKVTVTKSGLTIEASDPYNPPELDFADHAFANSNPTWTHVGGYIYKTDYQWYREQVTDDEYSEYNETEDAPLHVYEDDTMLRGYRCGFDPRFFEFELTTDPDWCGHNAYHGCAGPYRSIVELDPEYDYKDYEPENPRMQPANKPCTSHPWHKDTGVVGRFYYDEANTDLYVWSADEDSPSNHKYYIPSVLHPIKIQASDVTLRNLVIKHASSYAVTLENAHGSVIDHCFFINNHHDILVKHSVNAVISNNFIQEKGFWERYWYWDCKGHLCGGGTVRLRGTSRGTIIRGNVIYGSYFSIDGLQRPDVKIYNNIMAKTLSGHLNPSGYMGTDVLNLRIYNNIIHHGDGEAVIGSIRKGGPIWFYRNVLYHMGAMNRDGGESTAEESEGEAYYYHNTMSLAQNIVKHPYDYPVYKNSVYRNNIIHLRHYTMEMYWSYSGRNPTMGWSYFPFHNGPDSDYNLLWRNPRPPSNWGKIARFDLTTGDPIDYLESEFSDLQDDTGLETNSIQTDPEFVNSQIKTVNIKSVNYDDFSDMDYEEVISGGYDNLYSTHFNQLYHFFDVESGSDAIDNGEAIPSHWPDTVTVTDGQPDIGAVEYGACIEDWTCTPWSAWSACSGGTQTRTRTCTDDNTCGTENNKPAETETRSCGTLCGNSLCDSDECDSCPGDCSFSECCPDTICNNGETCSSCPADCGSCPATGASSYSITDTVTIDGNPSEWIDVAGFSVPYTSHVTLNYEPPTSNEDASAVFKSLWDGLNLYVLVQVTDDSIYHDSAAFYLDDSTELYLDGGHERASSYDSNDFQLAVDTNNDNGGIRSDQLSFQHAVTSSTNSYTVEYAVPFSALVAAPVDGTVMGFDIGVNDDDNGGAEDSQLMWNGDGTGWQDPRQFGEIVLVLTHRADNSPKDGCINFDELFAFIDLWKQNQATIGELMGAIGLWKGGC